MSGKQMNDGPLVIDLAEESSAAAFSLDGCYNMIQHIRRAVNNPLRSDPQSIESSQQNHAGNVVDNAGQNASSPVEPNSVTNLVESSQQLASSSAKCRNVSGFVDAPSPTKVSKAEFLCGDAPHSVSPSAEQSSVRQGTSSLIRTNSSCHNAVSIFSGKTPCEASSLLSCSPDIKRETTQFLRDLQLHKKTLYTHLRSGNLAPSLRWQVRCQLVGNHWHKRFAKRHLRELEQLKIDSIGENGLDEKGADAAETANVTLPVPRPLSRTDVEIVEVNKPKDSPDSPDEKELNPQNHEHGFLLPDRALAVSPFLYAANADFANAIIRQTPPWYQTKSKSVDPRLRCNLAVADQLRFLDAYSKLNFKKWRDSANSFLKRHKKLGKCAEVAPKASRKGGTGTVRSAPKVAFPADNGVQAYVQAPTLSTELVKVVELNRPKSGLTKTQKRRRSRKANKRRKFLVGLPLDQVHIPVARFAENCRQHQTVPDAIDVQERVPSNINSDVEVVQVFQDAQGVVRTCSGSSMPDLQKTRTSDYNSSVKDMQGMQNMQQSINGGTSKSMRVEDEEVVQNHHTTVASDANSDSESTNGVQETLTNSATAGVNGNTENPPESTSVPDTGRAVGAISHTSISGDTVSLTPTKLLPEALTGHQKPSLDKISNASAFSSPMRSLPGTSQFQVRGNLVLVQPHASVYGESRTHTLQTSTSWGSANPSGQNQPVGQQMTNLPKKEELMSMEPEIVSCREESITFDPASSVYKAYKLSDDLACVCVSCPTEEIALKGKVSVRVILGKVTILGYALHPRKAYHDVYSPETTSLLSFKCERGTKAPMFAKASLQAVLKEKMVPKELAETILARTHRNAVVFLLRKLTDVPCQYVSNFREYRYLFDFGTLRGGLRDVNTSVSFLGCHFADPQQVRTVRITPAGCEAVEKVKQAVVNETGKPQVIVICGGKNVGKSTFCRFLINSLLSDHRVCKKVCYLECDVGQTEFTPSGCVSLNVVQRPLLGPPFTHQRIGFRTCYFGCKSPSDDPIRYVSCLKFVHRGYLKKYAQKKIPLIVNTMGWTRGMGLNFLVDTLALTRPTHVIQFQHPSQNKSLPRVDNAFLSRTSGMVFQLQSVSHQHFYVDTAGHIYDKFRDYKAVDHRNLSLMTYLGKSLVVNVDTRNLSLEALRPYTVPWHTVAVHVSTASVPRHLVMLSLNASVVGLCGVPEDNMITVDDESMPKFLQQTPVCHCYGFGIVRIIDPVQKIFYIITPLSLNQLYNVNALIKGALEIPECIMVNQNCPGEIPYVQTSSAPNMVAGDRPVRRQRTAWSRKRKRRYRQISDGSG